MIDNRTQQLAPEINNLLITSTPTLPSVTSSVREAIWMGP
jgi:hypothetical protein